MCDSPYQALRSLTASSGARTSSMADTHVGFAHLGIVRHRAVIAFGQHPAARQHGDAVAEIFDHAQTVLDDQHGAVGGDALAHGRTAVDVLVAHAVGPLIDQHELRT